MLSIITPVLNGSAFIEKNIRSVRQLSIPHEHIIVDGGSTDGTLDIVQKYPHTTLLHQKEQTGMYGAIDQGIRESKGHYLTWINADDSPIDDGYKRMYELAKGSDADLVYSHGIYHYTEEHRYKKIYAKHFARYLLKEGVSPFVQPSSLFSRKAYEKAGGFNYEQFKLIGDRDLFQRMACEEELKFLYVPVFSSLFLRYSGSLLYRNLEQRKEEYRYCIKTNPSLFNRTIFHMSQLVRALEYRIKYGR